MTPTRSPFGSLIACVITSRSPLVAERTRRQRAARLPADQRLLEQPPQRMIGRAAASSSDAPGAASGSSARIAGLANSSSPRGLTIATASSSCSTADSRLATWPAICERSADSCALTVLKNVPSSPNSSSCVEIRAARRARRWPRRVKPLRIT